MKRGTLLLFGSLIFAVSLTIFQSCGRWFVSEFTICDISFSGSAFDSSDSTDLITFEEEVVFYIQGIAGEAICSRPAISFMNGAYATTICHTYLNELMESSFELSLGRPIVFMGDTIAAEVDLLSVPELESRMEIAILPDCKFYRASILFPEELLTDLEFLQGEYPVMFRCETTDGISFERNRETLFRE